MAGQNVVFGFCLRQGYAGQIAGVRGMLRFSMVAGYIAVITRIITFIIQVLNSYHILHLFCSRIMIPSCHLRLICTVGTLTATITQTKMSKAYTTNNFPSQAHVLLVDDDVSALDISEFILQQAGHVITTAFNGKEGLFLLGRSAKSSRPVNLVITDLAMPVMSGVDFIPEIRKRGFTVPVLVTTGCIESYSEPAIKNMGADHILLKPFDAVALTECVAAMLARKLPRPVPASPLRLRRPIGPG
ncbi:MAG: response regulator [Verrucomicrobiota bacterium]